MTAEGARGVLYVVGTPIGNLEDITYRAVRILGEVDLVAAEDTRSARTLLARYDLRCRTVSYFAGNEARRAAELLKQLQDGARVALISESGMPGVSDPGERLIQRCVEAGVPVEVIPGPTAAVAALVASGLPTAPYAFYGFLPRAGAARRRALEQLRIEPGAVVLYESPRRVGATLLDLLEGLGDRPAALVRELTKLHEEVVRDSLAGLAERYRDQPPRGEVTLVIGPAADAAQLPAEALEQEIQDRLAAGESPRQIADALAAHGKRVVYQRALALRRGLP